MTRRPVSTVRGSRIVTSAGPGTQAGPGPPLSGRERGRAALRLFRWRSRSSPNGSPHRPRRSAARALRHPQPWPAVTTLRSDTRRRRRPRQTSPATTAGSAEAVNTILPTTARASSPRHSSLDSSLIGGGSGAGNNRASIHHRRTATGHCAWCRTAWLTEPSKVSVRVPRPRDPTTSSAACWDATASRCPG